MAAKRIIMVLLLSSAESYREQVSPTSGDTSSETWDSSLTNLDFAQNYITCTKTNCWVLCKTDSACEGTLIDASRSGSLQLYCSSAACKYIQLMHGAHNVTDISCLGERSCSDAFFEMQESTQIHLLCDSISSCNSALLYADNLHAQTSVSCNAFQSCLDIEIGIFDVTNLDLNCAESAGCSSSKIICDESSTDIDYASLYWSCSNCTCCTCDDDTDDTSSTAAGTITYAVIGIIFVAGISIILYVYFSHVMRKKKLHAISQIQAQAQAQTATNSVVVHNTKPQSNTIYVAPNTAAAEPVRDKVATEIAETQEQQMQVEEDYKDEGESNGLLPDGWRMLCTSSGRVYYQNDTTKITQWQRPSTESDRSISVQKEHAVELEEKMEPHTAQKEEVTPVIKEEEVKEEKKITHVEEKEDEEERTDEITDDVKIYQFGPCYSSDQIYGLSFNGLRERVDNSQKVTWIIFDCGRYEINTISIKFGKYARKPDTVALRMSDVAPLYSFKIPPVNEWNFESKDEYVPQMATFTFSGNEYNSGFKRFIHLEFNKGVDTIEKMSFFGTLSSQIPDDDEQFDKSDYKQDKSDKKSIHKPKVVDNSPTINGSVDDIWKPESNVVSSRWSSRYPAFLTIDLGHNKVEEISISSSQMHPYKTLIIYTSDDIHSEEWILLLQDNEMEAKIAKPNQYKLQRYTLKQYLKLEFLESPVFEVGISCIKLYGRSVFLTKLNIKPFRIEDMKDMKYIDEDVIERYRNMKVRQYTSSMMSLGMKLHAVEQNKNKGVLSEEWRTLKQKHIQKEYGFKSILTEVSAYQAATKYETEQMLKMAGKQKQITQEEVTKRMKFEVEHVQKIKALKDRFHTLTDKTEVEECQKEIDVISSKYDKEQREIIITAQTNIYSVFRNARYAKIYETWKEAVHHQPRQLSMVYNVMEYQESLRYGYLNDEDGVKQCWHKLLQLFAQSLKEKQELLHKFFVFQLSANKNSWSHLSTHKRQPVHILLDCGVDLDRNIHCVEFKTSKTDEHTKVPTFDHMIISTCDEMADNKKSDYSIIGESEFPDQNMYNLDFDDTRIILNAQNRRYLRIEFANKDPVALHTSIRRRKFFEIERIRVISQDTNDVTKHIGIIDCTENVDDYHAHNLLADNEQTYRAKLTEKFVIDSDMIENTIRDEVCRGVNLLRKSRGGKISKQQKHFIKFLLCFQNDRHYKEMLHAAKLVMNILRKELDVEYKRLQSTNSDILSLKVDEKDECQDIRSMHQLLEWDYNKWYKSRNAMFWPNDLQHIAQEWMKTGLDVTDPEFTQLRRESLDDEEKSFCASDDLAMEYLNLIAFKLNPSFQSTMKQLFEENRKKLNLIFPPNDNDLGVKSGPVKTKARQKIKILLKYFSRPSPQCMAVLDIVRCAIICDNDEELCSLFRLIMNRFSGSVLRVKNAFDDVKKGDDSHGYRAVMINIVYCDESLLPKEYRFVCEAQLLLNKYYQVRKNMHLGYGITRSEDGGVSMNKKPSAVLAQDSCKLGNLDI